MAFNYIAWAFDTPLKQPAKPVLIALANRADDKGECFPSIATIGDDLGFSRNSRNRIRRALEELQELGYVSVFAQYRGKGQQTSNLFKLHLGHVHQPLKQEGGAYSTTRAYSTPHEDERPVRQADAQCTPGAQRTGVGAYSTTNQSSNPSSSLTTEEETRTRENEEFEALEAPMTVGNVPGSVADGVDPDFDWFGHMGKWSA